MATERLVQYNTFQDNQSIGATFTASQLAYDQYFKNKFEKDNGGV